MNLDLEGQQRMDAVGEEWKLMLEFSNSVRQWAEQQGTQEGWGVFNSVRDTMIQDFHQRLLPDSIRKIQGTGTSTPTEETAPLFRSLVQEHRAAVAACRSSPPARPAALPHLKVLLLENCTFWVTETALKQQLQVLPSLQDLRILGCMFSEGAVSQLQHILAVRDSVSSQLVNLQWDGSKGIIRSMLAGSPLPQLQRLCARSSTVNDKSMEQLLQNAPSLRSLHVAGLHLRGDYKHTQCSWEVITMERSVDIQSLACLPLSSRPKLYVGRSKVAVHIASTEGSADDSSLQLTAAAATVSATTAGTATAAVDDLRLAAVAAAVVEECGGLQPAPGVTPSLKHIIVSGKTASHGDVLLQATLPMLGNITGSITLKNVHVTRGILKAINRDLPHCSKVTFTRGCTYEEGSWGGMATLLQNVSCICMFSEAAILRQLTVLCAAAIHPVTLDLSNSQHGAWQDELVQAIRDAGHGLVELDLGGFDIDGTESDDEEGEDEEGEEEPEEQD